MRILLQFACASINYVLLLLLTRMQVYRNFQSTRRCGDRNTHAAYILVGSWTEAIDLCGQRHKSQQHFTSMRHVLIFIVVVVVVLTGHLTVLAGVAWLARACIDHYPPPVTHCRQS